MAKADQLETLEVKRVRIVKLTESECQKLLDLLKTVQSVTQEYAGEINESGTYTVINELKQLAHLVEYAEQALETALKERLYEELLLRIEAD